MTREEYTTELAETALRLSSMRREVTWPLDSGEAQALAFHQCSAIESLWRLVTELNKGNDREQLRLSGDQQRQRP